MVHLDDIKSNNVQRCLHCGRPITPDNDSGWEAFTDDGKTTQPVCGWCELKLTGDTEVRETLEELEPRLKAAAQRVEAVRHG